MKTFLRTTRWAAFLILGGFLASAAVAAPALTIGSGSGQAGSTVNLAVSFNPGTDSVASIQFNLTLPASISTVSATAGTLLTSIQKDVNTSLAGNVWTFVVFGLNQSTIGSGSMLTAQVRIKAGTALGNISLPVSGVVYSDPNGQSITPGSNTNGTVTVVSAIPVITGSTATATAGAAFTYKISATNSPTSYNATGLPAGLSPNTTTGVISGTPTASGTFSVTLSATNSGGTGTKTLTLTVNPAAPVVSASTATAIAGSPFTYQIAATNSPTSYGATGLPSGLTANTTTGLISGTPVAAGTSTVTLTATNAGGTGTRTLTLFVKAQAPAITSATSATAKVGIAFTYQIVATNSPTGYNATGLPAGLSPNTTTGLISGTPNAAGSFNATLSASNSGGSSTQNLSLTVNSACDINSDGQTNINDVQLSANQASMVSPCTADINRDTRCDVLDLQLVVNAVLNGQCVTP